MAMSTRTGKKASTRVDVTNKDKLLQKAADAKLVHLNSNTIFPLLTRRIDETVAGMCHLLKKDGTVRTADVAYISACRDLMQELEAIARNGDKAAIRVGAIPEILK